MADEIIKEGLLKVGTTLSNGKYRIEGYLASGGFGNTYVATDTAFDEKVAIKELFIKGVCGRQEDSSDVSISLSENKRAFSQQQEKFRKEARRLRKLSNSHIVSVHDLFDDNGTSYYVMDFIDGESLSNKLKRTKKPMAEAELMLILPQILDALETVHNEEIWHLDLKPANIMLDRKGNVQLIDFGASKQLRNSNGDSLSTSSAMAYTPGYASSEQMEQNIEKFGAWTDLYSLGATLYNLLTLQQPPSPSDIDEDAMAALKMPATISKKTQNLIFWLTKPNRKMRPQSVADVKQFLLEVADNTSVKPKQNVNTGDDDTVIKRPVKPAVVNTKKEEKSSNNMLKVVVGVIAAACVAGGIFLFGGSKNDADIQDEETETTAVAMKSVTDLRISVQAGPVNMREYTFTGDIADSIGALPNGRGIAKFAKYQNIPPSTYEGEFVNGVCEDNTGKATMTFSTGDKFVGAFANGYYSTGRYILADKSYFEGSFKEGSPYNGKWYEADGTLSGIVKNGVEE